MTDDNIIKDFMNDTDVPGLTITDMRTLLRIAVLQARLDEWSHVPRMTAARNRGRMQKLYDDIQELRVRMTVLGSRF